MHLSKLLDFRDEIPVFHVRKEGLHGCAEVLGALIYFDPITKPFRDLGPIRLPGVAFIYKDYGAEVLHVTDDSADGLIHCTGRLLPVPVLARESLELCGGLGSSEFPI